MPKTVETTVYKFSELSERAKERARDWYRGCIESDEIAESVIDDAASIAEILGIEFNQKPVKLMNGKTRYEPCIWWSGFSSQGDGACFEGHYRYAKGSVKAIKAYAPKDTELHRIAVDLANIQKRFFYKLEARMTLTGSYSHSGCMSVEMFSEITEYWDSHSNTFNIAWGSVQKLMRDFADWIYSRLEKNNKYLMSDENVDECIEINEYDFNEDGGFRRITY